MYRAFTRIFFLASRFSATSVAKHCFNSAKFHQNGFYHKCFQHSIVTLSSYFLLTYQLICFLAHIHSLAIEEEKFSIGTPNILHRKIKPIVLIIPWHENFKLNISRWNFTPFSYLYIFLIPYIFFNKIYNSCCLQSEQITAIKSIEYWISYKS